MQESIELFLHKKVVVLHDKDSISVAARAMEQNDIGSVLVSDNDGSIVGIITDRDLVCKGIAKGFDEGTSLSEVMSSTLVTLEAWDSVYDALILMKKHGVRRLPVLQKNSSGKDHFKAIGMITFDDLIASKEVAINDLADVVRGQIKLRSRGIPDRMRSLERAEQTYNEFLQRVENTLGLKRGGTEEFLRFTLGSLILRMTYRNAAHFLAQFPRRLQNELELMMVGPDRSITAESLVEGVSHRFNRTEEESREWIRKLWNLLPDLLAETAVDHALHQFPKDIQHLLTGEPASKKTPPKEKPHLTW